MDGNTANDVILFPLAPPARPKRDRRPKGPKGSSRARGQGMALGPGLDAIEIEDQAILIEVISRGLIL